MLILNIVALITHIAIIFVIFTLQVVLDKDAPLGMVVSTYLVRFFILTGFSYSLYEIATRIYSIVMW